MYSPRTWFGNPKIILEMSQDLKSGSSCFGVNCDVWIEQRRDKLKGKVYHMQGLKKEKEQVKRECLCILVTSRPSLGYVTSHPRSGVSITFISRSTFLVGKCAIDNHLIMDNLVKNLHPSIKMYEELQFLSESLEQQGNDAKKNLIAKLDSAKSKLVEIAQMKSKLVTENNKVARLSKFLAH